MKISVSYLKSMYDKKTTIERIESSTADYIHVDLMDGKFVPNCNFQMSDVLLLLKNTKKKLDVHLMTKDLEQRIDEISTLNPKYLTFHLEATDNPRKIIEKIKEKNILVGIAIKPLTNVSEIVPYLKELDQVLVMSVEPGAGGQKFMDSTINKIKELKQLQKEYHFIINVDGGINQDNIELLKESHVECVVVGTFICNHSDFQTQINLLK